MAAEISVVGERSTVADQYPSQTVKRFLYVHLEGSRRAWSFGATTSYEVREMSVREGDAVDL